MLWKMICSREHVSTVCRQAKIMWDVCSALIESLQLNERKGFKDKEHPLMLTVSQENSPNRTNQSVFCLQKVFND